MAPRRMKERLSDVVAAVVIVLIALVGEQPLSAQLADASATTLGLSGNNTATVRGLGAISVNPAGLAMEGSNFSLALFPTQVRSNLDPIHLADLSDVQRMVIPEATKDEWLTRVTTEGGQTGSFGVDISEVAVTSGNVGLQVSTIMVGAFSLPPGVVEGLLYGNAGRTGSPSRLDLTNASLEGFAISTAGLSIGIPVPVSSMEMAVGLTVKYSIGHDVFVGQSTNSSIEDGPVRAHLNLPMVQAADGYIADLMSSKLRWKVPQSNGSGFGIDAGFMMKRGSFAFGASVQNIFNNFSWDTSKLKYRPGTVLLEFGQNSSDFALTPYVSAPASLRALIDRMTFEPTFRAGASLDLTTDLTLSGDFHRQARSPGISLSSKSHMGLGVEFRGMKVLHLRGGAAVITDGMQYGGGASLVLGPMNLSIAGALQMGVLAEKGLGQVTLSFGGR